VCVQLVQVLMDFILTWCRWKMMTWRCSFYCQGLRTRQICTSFWEVAQGFTIATAWRAAPSSTSSSSVHVTWEGGLAGCIVSCRGGVCFNWQKLQAEIGARGVAMGQLPPSGPLSIPTLSPRTTHQFYKWQNDVRSQPAQAASVETFGCPSHLCLCGL